MIGRQDYVVIFLKNGSCRVVEFGDLVEYCCEHADEIQPIYCARRGLVRNKKALEELGGNL